MEVLVTKTATSCFDENWIDGVGKRSLRIVLTLLLLGLSGLSTWARAQDDSSIQIRYGALVDRDADTHAQQPLGTVLLRMDALSLLGEAPEPEVIALVEPFLEP